MKTMETQNQNCEDISILNEWKEGRQNLIKTLKNFSVDLSIDEEMEIEDCKFEINMIDYALEFIKLASCESTKPSEFFRSNVNRSIRVTFTSPAGDVEVRFGDYEPRGNLFNIVSEDFIDKDDVELQAYKFRSYVLSQIVC